MDITNNSNALTKTKDLDTALEAVPLLEDEKDIVNEIINAPDKQALQQQFDRFNITQSKKNALRIIKLTTLLDKVEDQAIERFEKRPDQVSNREILDYMQVVSGQIDRSQKIIDTLEERPMIKVNQTNEVNINVEAKLDRESKERVMNAVNALLAQINKPKEPTVELKDELIMPEEPVIVVENVKENSENEENS